MSDVWQGPGWWLASDGKWYPAEAESGAVFEGEIPGAETTTVAEAGAATATEAEPVVVDEPAVAAEPVVAEPVAVEPVVAEPVVAEPVAVEPVVTEPVVAEPVIAEPVAVEPVVAKPVVAEPVAAEPVALGEPNLEPVPLKPLPTEPLEAESLVPAEPLLEAESLVAAEPLLEAEPLVADTATPENPFETSSPFEESANPFAAADPLVPEIPTVETPEIPEIAEIPEALDIPEIPEIPEALDIPEIPEIPEVLDIPEVAEIPEVPTIGEMPAISEELPVAPVAEGGWQAIAEPEVDVPGEGWETTFPGETPLPEAAQPEIDTSSVAAAPLAPFDPPVVATPPPVEEVTREDAWRKPIADSPEAMTTPLASTTSKPEVVDLALPEKTTPPVFDDDSGKKGILVGALAAIVLLGGIIWLALRLFSNGDETADTDTDVPESAAVEDEDDTLDGGAEATEATDETASEVISVFDVRAGDCIVGDIDGQILEVERVDCDVAHDFEIYREAIIDSITAFDETAISAFAEDVCRTSLAELVSADDERSISFKFFQPTVDSWNQADAPDRLVTCLGFDEDAQLIGRLDGS